MKTNSILILLAIFLTSCHKNEDSIIAMVYKQNNQSNYSGNLYTTKYGGLNYYVPKREHREKLMDLSNVDSIVFNIGDRKYIAKPLKKKNYSRERNKSDFSFFVDKVSGKIVADTISEMQTILLISENTDIENLKEKETIKAIVIEKE